MDSTSDSIQPYTTTMTSLTTIMTSLTTDLYSPATSFSNANHNSSHNSHNMTQQEIQEYLEHLQNEEFQIYIPALSFIVFLAVVGLFGNILVLMVYKSKFHRTPTRIFIMAIAMFDLIANVVCVPAIAYDMFYLWNYPNPILCGLTRYANASTTITSASILLVLSVARYRKICRPFGKQVTTCHAKILSVSMAIFGWLASIPFGILNGIHTRPTPRSGIFGYECSIGVVYVDTIWPLVNNAFFFLLFFSLCAILIILYILIGIKAFKHSKIHGRSMVNMKTTTTPICTHTISMTDDNQGKPNKAVLAKLLDLKKQKKYKISTQSKSLDSIDSEPSKDEGNRKQKDEPFLKEKKEGTPAYTREDTTNSAKKARRLRGGDKTVVNFSMVRELTVKLKDIKQTDDASSSSSDKETPTSPKESDCGDDGVVVGSNTGPANMNIEAKPQTTQGPNEYDEEGTDQCISKDEVAKPQEAAPAEDQIQDSGNKGVAFSLNWIDVAYSLHGDNDGSARATPSNKSRKVSRENSLLQKHRKIREALQLTLNKGKQKVKDNDQVDDNKDVVDEVNDTSDSEGEAIDEAKRSQHTSQKRGSFINRTTAMLILITSVYVLSYVPYLILAFFRFTQPDDFQAMGKVSQAIHHFFLCTYFVNSAANAIIYSLCDNRFRREAVNLFRCKVRNF